MPLTANVTICWPRLVGGPKDGVLYPYGPDDIGIVYTIGEVEHSYVRTNPITFTYMGAKPRRRPCH